MRFIHVVICLTIGKKKLSPDTEYNKMAVKVSFVVIKAQHGVSARTKICTNTPHVQRKKGGLTETVS